MEIDKDKLVEAAKAVVSSREDSRGLKHMDKCINELCIALTPAHPSKEKCIEYLNEFIECVGTQDELFIKGAISHLKEPSLQWVKNTGVMPEYKVCMVKYNRGYVKLLENIDPDIWQIDEKDPFWDIKEYIILE